MLSTHTNSDLSGEHGFVKPVDAEADVSHCTVTPRDHRASGDAEEGWSSSDSSSSSNTSGPRSFSSLGSSASEDESGTARARPAPRKATRTAYAGETEISMSRIMELGKLGSTSATQDTMAVDSGVVTMSSIGQLGRFGNQVLQYVFLRVYARVHGLDFQVPDWIGAHLFGHADDASISANVVPVRESPESAARANSTFTDIVLDQLKAKAGGADLRSVDEANLLLGGGAAPGGIDLWGWFQINTAAYAPHKDFVRSLIQPVPALAEHMHSQVESKLRTRNGRPATLVAIHVRRGDYADVSMASFAYVVPMSWYASKLAELWPTLENPVLYVATDDPKLDMSELAEFNPLNCKTAALSMPEHMAELKAFFYPDYFALTQADIVLTSNSTFSFTASMVNERPNARFFRPFPDGLGGFRTFDPWAAFPIHHSVTSDAHPVERLFSAVRVLYQTQGLAATIFNVSYKFPVYAARNLLMRAIVSAGFSR